MSGRALIAWIAAIIAAWGCGPSGDPDQAGSSRAGEKGGEPRPATIVDHGVRVGTAMSSRALTCTDKKRRLLAPSQGLQLATFTSISDCSVCMPHLEGMARLVRSKVVSIEHVFVVYAPQENGWTILRAYQRIGAEPVCWDPSGYVWSRYGIAHTPVTLLLRDGMIVYVHDGPLDPGPATERFKLDLRYYEDQYAAGTAQARAVTQDVRRREEVRH